MSQPNWQRISWLDVAALNKAGATTRAVSDGETFGHRDIIWQADINTIPPGFSLSPIQQSEPRDGRLAII